MILLFQRTATGSICPPWPGHVSENEANALVKKEIRNGMTHCEYSGDYFQELEDITVPEHLNFKCLAAPFTIDPKSIEICSGASSDYATICYEASQNCLFFANGIDVDTAITMASIAAVADNVEESIMVDTRYPNRWELSAPEGVPQEVLTRCAPAFIPKSILRKPSKKSVCAVG